MEVLELKENISRGRSVNRTNENKKRKVIVITPNGIVNTFNGIRDACRFYDLNSANLSRVARGISKHTKGYKAEYI